MKKLLILCALFSANAHAMNIMYQRSSDVLTGAPAIFYATDEHDAACKGDWYKAAIIDNDGTRMKRPTFCWTWVGLNDQGDSLGIQVLSLDSGYVQTHVNLYPIIGPISGPARVKIQMDAVTSNQLLFRKFIIDMQSSQPHP